MGTCLYCDMKYKIGMQKYIDNDRCTTEHKVIIKVMVIMNM